jgi:hypothetical protein
METRNLLGCSYYGLRSMAERVGFEPSTIQQNKQIRRREWHTKPPQFSENKQRDVLLDAYWTLMFIGPFFPPSGRDFPTACTVEPSGSRSIPS